MNNVQKDLLSLLSNRLFGRATDATVSQELLREAKLHAVSSLIYSDIKTIATNIKVKAAHADLTRDLAGIPFVTFKGFVSSYYYPEPEYRPMGDIDFYVMPEYYERAAARLREKCYTPLEKEHERHESFKKHKFEFELHSEIKGIPNGRDGIITDIPEAEAKIRGYLSDIIDTARTVHTDIGDIVIPDDFHHGLVMLLHVAGHMMNNDGVGLRHLCDWAVYADKVDVNRFEAELRNVGLWRFACQLTSLSSEYLGLRQMPWITQKDKKFLADLIEDILAAGDFGKKEAGRGFGTKMTRSNNPLVSFSRLTRKKFPVVDRHPVLLPFGMAAHFIKYLSTRITGKKRWIKMSILSEGARRNKLYSQFRLFEKD